MEINMQDYKVGTILSAKPDTRSATFHYDEWVVIRSIDDTYYHVICIHKEYRSKHTLKIHKRVINTEYEPIPIAERLLYVQ